MTILETVLIFLLATSLMLLGIVLVYFKYFKAYTREKFAFRVFLLIGSLVATLITIIFSGNSVIAGVVRSVARLLGITDVEFQPSFSDKALAVFLIVALIYLGTKLHRNWGAWGGAISTREHEAELVGIKPGLVGGTVAAIADITGKEPLQTYSPARASRQIADIPLSPSETKAWHHWVARILQISSNQIHIDELKDWFSDRKLFVSSYGLNRAPIGVL